MKTPQLLNYERDRWVAGDGNLAEIPSAIDGAPVAMTGSAGIDFGSMLRHAREVGGPALRKLTFHDRAHMAKALGLAIMERKEELYELNYQTGATRKDGWIDIAGGVGALFDHPTRQDLVRLTGPAHLAHTLKGHPRVVPESGHFVSAQDRGAAALLGPDPSP